MKINLANLLNNKVSGFVKTNFDKKSSTVTIQVSKSKFAKFINDIFGNETRKLSKILNTPEGQKALKEAANQKILVQNLNKINANIQEINKGVLCAKIKPIVIPKPTVTNTPAISTVTNTPVVPIAPNTPIPNTPPIPLLFPEYALPVMNDPEISNNAKDLFKLVFIDLIHPENLQKAQPLGHQLNLLQEKLDEFNQMHGTQLFCRKTQHSFGTSDPWQTIKLTEPTITTIDQVSPLLNELNQILFEKYGIQSNGGDDCMVIDGRKKNTPQCFKNNKGEIISPQLLLSLIDFKRIFGIINDKSSYIKALKDAYSG